VRKAENRVPPFVLPLVKTMIFAADAVLAVLCFTLAFWWREGDAILSETAWAWSRRICAICRNFVFRRAVPSRNACLSKSLPLHGAFSYINEAIKIFKAVAVGSLLIVSVGVSVSRRFRVSGIFLFARRFSA
jgi:hypothetical protein